MFLVTGANGFVGRVLCDSLAQQGRPVVAGVRSRSDKNICPPGQIRELGNLTGKTDWCGHLDGVEVVLHLAGRAHVLNETAADPMAEFRETNVKATLRLAEQAVEAGVRRFVFVSSIGVHGPKQGQALSEADAPAPIEPYAISKWEAEQELMRLAERSRIELVIVRPPLVYGPGCPGNFERLLRLAWSRVPLPLGSIKSRRSFISVWNLADFLVRTATAPTLPRQAYVVSDGQDVSLPALLSVFAEGFGRGAHVFPFPPTLLRLGAMLLGKRQLFEKVCGDLQVDSRCACAELRWSPPVSMRDGLLRTARAYAASRAPGGSPT